jgi:hypothetical protein
MFSDELRGVWDRIPPRNADSDSKAAKLVRADLKEFKKIGGLVVVDSGGPHGASFFLVDIES